LLSQAIAGVALAPAGILMDAVRTGAVFSLLQGAFYQVRAVAAAAVALLRLTLRLQIGNMMSGKKSPEEDMTYLHTKAMLTSLGLASFEKNFRKGQLDDLTLPLLTDSALKEVRIPPGPRLRILQHVAYSRAAASASASRGNQALGPLSLALAV